LFVSAGAREPRKRRQASGGFLPGRRFGSAVEHAHDVAFLHDQVFDTLDLNLCARPLAEQHAVANLEVDGDQLAVIVAAPGTDADDLALLGLLLGGVGDNDAAGGLGFGINTLDHDAVVKRAKFHALLLSPEIVGKTSGAR